MRWIILRQSSFSMKLYTSNLSGYKLSEADYKIFSKIACVGTEKKCRLVVKWYTLLPYQDIK